VVVMTVGVVTLMMVVVVVVVPVEVPQIQVCYTYSRILVFTVWKM
jgi:hypothetical protein